MPAPSYQNRPRCTARSKQTGERCKNTAVPGKTVCRFHGGLSSGPPRGSKNALRTGAHETILEATMTEDERAYLDGLELDPRAVLRDTLKLLRLRELRVMQRIRTAREAEALAGRPTGEVDENGKPRLHPALMVKGGSRTAMNGTQNSGTSTTMISESYAAHIAGWEKGLTEIQDQIRRTADALARLEAAGGGEEKPVEIVLNMGGADPTGRHADEAWAGETGEGA